MNASVTEWITTICVAALTASHVAMWFFVWVWFKSIEKRLKVLQNEND